MVNLRWLLKYTSGWIKAPEEPSVAFFLEIPGYRVILLWTTTQAQRDHEIFHTKNFRVQPHAIMGSSIVD